MVNWILSDLIAWVEHTPAPAEEDSDLENNELENENGHGKTTLNIQIKK